jgi:peroxiredoxin
MLRRVLLVILVFISLRSNAQNVQQILKESYEKCRTVRNGYYDMEMKMKFMDNKDTTDYGRYKFYFNRIQNDSLYPVTFNCELYSDNYVRNTFRYVRNTLYTGNEYVTYSKNDSTAQIRSKSRWITDLMQKRGNDYSSFYQPLVYANCYPLPKDSDYIDHRHQFKFVGKELLNNTSCYHVQMIDFPLSDTSKILYTIEKKYDYWIHCEDMIPIKYSESLKLLQFGDTLLQYKCYTLKEYHLNDPKNLIPLQLSYIPAYCNIRDYVKPKTIELLSKDTIAPAFTLTSLQSNPISLSGFKGQLVLIDFFYKACYPCMQAIPVLESFHEKYKAKGLNVIGIDPLDKEVDELKHFASITGISYPVLLDQKEVNQFYHVNSYPTIYLIGKKGNILFAQSGFDKSVEHELEEIIRNNL